jgi:SAM-dependent methyltransferase
VSADSKADQYARRADAWSATEYADPHTYLEHRADLVVGLGPRLAPGDEVLDLACGDGGLGASLLARGLRYRGVDAEPAMVEAARRNLAGAAPVELGDLNDASPPGPVAATTVFRALYYARDRAAFFRHAAAFTEKKLVFDLNPRQYRVDDVVHDLRAAGLGRVELRPFLVPQTRSLPGPVLAALVALERAGPLARLLLRARFTYVVVASRG